MEARRDIAMLGVVHQTALGKGSKHFKEFFKMDGGGRMEDPRKSIGGKFVKRSALGLPGIYNMLPVRTWRLKLLCGSSFWTFALIS